MFQPTESHSPPVQRVLALLGAAGCRPKKQQKGWIALCPAHPDGNASLSINEGDDGCALLNCFAGCDTKDVVAKLGLSMRDLYANAAKAKKPMIALADLAAAKGLPESFLRGLGVKNHHGSVKITYRLEDGREHCRQRRRTALAAREGSSWYNSTQDEPIVPYGLWRLAETRNNGVLILCEGESDCWTCWFHGFPALGIPGASMSRYLAAAHLEGIRRVFIVQEPGDGGEAFVKGVGLRLRQIGWRGEVRIIRLLNGVKDPNELHRQNPAGFKDRFEEALRAASPPPRLEMDWGLETVFSPPLLCVLRPVELTLYAGIRALETLRGVKPGEAFGAADSNLQEVTGLSDGSIRTGMRGLESRGLVEVIFAGSFKERVRRSRRIRRVLPIPEAAVCCTPRKIKMRAPRGRPSKNTASNLRREKAKDRPVSRLDFKVMYLRKEEGILQGGIEPDLLPGPTLASSEDSVGVLDVLPDAREQPQFVPWEEVGHWPKEKQLAFEEQAARIEFEGNKPREKAEWEAYLATKNE
ncbi:MAG: hypothetical protein C4523_14070 [Myxococcales bacterium]|nr:MAG: hypothetical protein C4523_14070 [Myxococcales bacterium]